MKDRILKILFNGKSVGQIPDNGQDKTDQAIQYLETKYTNKEIEEGTIKISGIDRVITSAPETNDQSN